MEIGGLNVNVEALCKSVLRARMTPAPHVQSVPLCSLMQMIRGVAGRREGEGEAEGPCTLTGQEEDPGR